MFKNLYVITAITGGVLTAIVGYVQPSFISVPIAAAGGSLAGISACFEQRRFAEMKIREAAKVATAFQAAYSKNRGLVLAEEIAVFGDIPLEQACAFLEALAAENNGQALPAEQGTLFLFPHPENAIETLKQNAQAWAQSQVEAFQAENTQLKQNMLNIEQQLNAAAAAMAASNQQSIQKSRKLKDDSVDPWNNLL